MSAMLRTCKQEGMNTVTSVESTAPTNTYQCTDFKIKGCASSSSTTFSCLKLFANHHPFVKLWNAVIDLLEKRVRGRLVSEFTEASWSWNTTADHASSTHVMPQVTETIRSFLKPEAPPWQKVNCLANLPLLHLQADCAALPQSWKPLCKDGLSLRMGSSCFAPAKPKEVRLEKQVVQRARSRLPCWKALPLF